jgi:hypothetical protein
LLELSANGEAIMSRIYRGTAHDNGIKFWDIYSDAMNTAFNHKRFPHIVNGVSVYFIDLDLDPRLCENVQLVADVDEEIRAAVNNVGIETDAENTLREYVMMALLHALEKQGSAQKKYLKQLRGKMSKVQVDAQNKETKVNHYILALNGIN